MAIVGSPTANREVPGGPVGPPGIRTVTWRERDVHQTSATAESPPDHCPGGRRQPEAQTDHCTEHTAGAVADDRRRDESRAVYQVVSVQFRVAALLTENASKVEIARP